MAFKIGTVVKSRKIITDVDARGRPYIHTLKGGHGIVIAIVYDKHGYSEKDLLDDTPNGYTVAWEPEGHGVYDVNPDVIESVDPRDML